MSSCPSGSRTDRPRPAPCVAGGSVVACRRASARAPPARPRRRARTRSAAAPARCPAGAFAAALPRVQADVVVVAAGGQEGGRRELRLLVEAERVAVEGGRAGHVGDLQMHMTDAGLGRASRRGARPWDCASRSSTSNGSVTMFTPWPSGGPLPLRARPVRVDLDAQSVRIAQVQRLGDAVVGRAVDRPAGARDAPHGVRERRARRVQPGDVKQPVRPGGASTRLRDAGQLEQRVLGAPTEAARGRPRGTRPAARARARRSRRCAGTSLDGERHRADAERGVDRGELAVIVLEATTQR